MAIRGPRIPKFSRSQLVAGWLFLLVGLALAVIAAIGWMPFGSPVNLMLTGFFLLSGSWVVLGVNLMAFFMRGSSDNFPLTPRLREEEDEE
jgi:hypothetical protein